MRCVWEKLFGVDQKPYIERFKQFQLNIWPTLKKEKFDPLPIENWMKPLREKMVKFLTNLISPDAKKAIPRDDYKELIDLVLICLNAHPNPDVKFRKPGAFNKVKF